MFGLVSVLDNQSNSSFCWKHATRKYRYEHARGQAKYCLDVELKVDKDKGYGEFLFYEIHVLSKI